MINTDLIEMAKNLNRKPGKLKKVRCCLLKCVMQCSLKQVMKALFPKHWESNNLHESVRSTWRNARSSAPLRIVNISCCEMYMFYEVEYDSQSRCRIITRSVQNDQSVPIIEVRCQHRQTTRLQPSKPCCFGKSETIHYEPTKNLSMVYYPEVVL